MYESKTAAETVRSLGTDREKGLSRREAMERKAKYGANKLKEQEQKSVGQMILEQLNDPLILILVVAMAISLMLHEFGDAVIIVAVVVLNGAVGIIQEGKAGRAVEALKKISSPQAVAVRDGEPIKIPAEDLVVGDIVLLEAGNMIPADLRLIENMGIFVEESTITGESVPVEKDAEYVLDVPGDNSCMNMAYMSTYVTRGRGKGVVTATGMDTRIGHIADMLHGSKEKLTPLQVKLGELGKVLSALAVGICVFLFIVAVLQKRDVGEMLLTSVSLAVAAVPEGLPAIVTIVLALSVSRMVRAKTIVRKLSSVETLGAVEVVCSDKTGTLTQNRMTVVKCWLDGGLRRAEECAPKLCPDFYEGMVLCNDAVADEDSRTGDPTELALLDLALGFGIRKQELERRMPRMGELSFDSDRKMMTTLHKRENPDSQRMGQRAELRAAEFSESRQRTAVSYTKGAPDEVLKRCTGIYTAEGIIRLSDRHRRQILAAVEEMSGEALRTLAVAMQTGAAKATEENLTLLGMVGMRDPARPEAAAAVADFKEAGVKTVMITGDHVDTAYAIGRQLGIVQKPEQCMTGDTLEHLTDEEFVDRIEDINVFARVSPAQKVRIVEGFQKRGEIVAMTGDGVNDAPSLKKADIGIAMGLSGTDVARQASDMILTDDNFATIRRAIEEGRGVYENIRKSVIFLLSSNLGEIITMFVTVICGIAAPLKSSHILWINLITDSLPALALGVDRNDGKTLMRQHPRKADESLFARGGFLCTCFYGVLIGAVSLTAFLMLPCALLRISGMAVNLGNLAVILQNGTVLAKAQTYAFTVLGMSQLFHAVGMRDTQRSVFRMNHLENKVMILACLAGFALQFAVTEVPFLIQAFGTSSLSGREWMRLSILAAAPMMAHELVALGFWGKRRMR